MSAHGHSLLLPFDTDDEAFTRGFEAGVVWSLCRSDEDVVEVTAHGTNTEMLMRIAEATEREFSADIVDDVWVEVTFGRAGGGL